MRHLHERLKATALRSDRERTVENVVDVEPAPVRSEHADFIDAMGGE